jgi:predicted dienelactone hydrolase
MLKRGLAAAALALGMSLAAAQPHSAGLRSLELPYHGPAIEATLWYPSAGPESSHAFGPYSLRAAIGAAPAGGRFPLVLVSHGTGGTRLNHHLLAEALARHGFIVAALTHPGDNYRDRSMIADPRYWFERPRQLGRLLDALLADPAWKDRVDAARVGAIGHSAGGYTVLALIGGRPDSARLFAQCGKGADDPACRFRDPAVGVAEAGPPLKLPESVVADGELRDPRIRAALLLAPLGAPVAPGSLARSTARVKIVAAQHDEVLLHPRHFDYLRGELPQADAQLAPGAGHYSFIAPFAPAFKAALGEVAGDPPGFDRAGFQDRLATETVQFFQQALQR